MTEMPLAKACPGLGCELDDDEHVTGAVAFLIVENVANGRQHVQLAFTEGMSGFMARGLVELGREVLIADQGQT